MKEVAVSVYGLKKYIALALMGRLWKSQTSSPGTPSWLKTTLTRALIQTLTLVRHWLKRVFLGHLPSSFKLTNKGHQSLCHLLRELSTLAWIKQGIEWCTLKSSDSLPIAQLTICEILLDIFFLNTKSNRKNCFKNFKSTIWLIWGSISRVLSGNRSSPCVH